MEGLLVLVPTPIGNLGDMTFRAVEMLQSCEVIACEDTRHSRPLLAHFGIDRPLISYHQHNEMARAEELLARVRKGETVCVITDAGLPGISDPGAIIIRKAAEEDLPYTVLPGASAAPTALVAAGIGDGRFTFLGFLPRKGTERNDILRWIDTLPTTVVFYEAPHRIRRTMEELARRWPAREMALIREWTKTYEEVIRFHGAEIAEVSIPERGEFVVVIGPGAAPEAWDDEAVARRLKELAEEGKTPKEQIRQVVDESGRRRNEVYRIRETL